MQNKDQAKLNILELTSEAEHGSWEFWSDKNKTEEEGHNIIEAIKELVAEKKISAVEYKSIKDQSYKAVELDSVRLEAEVKRSMEPNVDPDNFYWFVATDEGKKEDLRLRSRA